MTSLEIFSICSSVVVLAAIPAGICVCAFYLCRISVSLRLMGERDITLIIKRLVITPTEEGERIPSPERRPQ